MHCLDCRHLAPRVALPVHSTAAPRPPQGPTPGSCHNARPCMTLIAWRSSPPAPRRQPAALAARRPGAATWRARACGAARPPASPAQPRRAATARMRHRLQVRPPPAPQLGRVSAAPSPAPQPSPVLIGSMELAPQQTARKGVLTLRIGRQAWQTTPLTSSSYYASVL